MPMTALVHVSSKLSGGWSDFLLRYRWDHVATLTVRYERKPAVLLKEFEQRFVRTLARVGQRRVSWFANVEGPDDEERAHLHCLLAGTRHIPVKRIERAWRGGFTRVTTYSGACAISYVTKGLRPDSDSWSLSRRIPHAERSI